MILVLFVNHQVSQKTHCLTRSGLAGAGDQALEAVLLLEDPETVCLGGNATAAGKQVESGAFTNQDLADWAVDVGTGLDGFQHLAFLDMPLDAGKKRERAKIAG